MPVHDRVRPVARNRRPFSISKFLLLIATCFAFVAAHGYAQPVIDVWGGATQSFGQLGTPQRWINILGNVTDMGDPDNPPFGAQLIYTLNSDPTSREIGWGPNGTRLLEQGDFNIDLAVNDPYLVSGSNTIIIKADNGTDTSSTQVTVNFTPGVVWSLPYSIDWSTVNNIRDVAQITDGDWDLSSSGIRPLDPGYDRVITIGDTTWTDYQVTVPVAIYGIDSSGNYALNGAGIGIWARWKGHTDDPVPNQQPKAGWQPFGADGWYNYNSNHGGPPFLAINEQNDLGSNHLTRTLAFDSTYVFKFRAMSEPGGTWFHFKVWNQQSTEPLKWTLIYPSTISPSRGSALLVAHAIDATFGNVEIVPVIKADVRFFLEGPYNTVADSSMFNTLKTSGYLATKFSGMNIPANAVDSVTIEIRDSASASASTVRKFQPAWLLKNGTIKDFVDTSLAYVAFGVPSGSYHIVVHHRNHLSVMSTAVQALSGAIVRYDFSTAQTQAYGTNAMVAAGTRFALFSGDVNKSGIVTAADANEIFGALNVTGYNNNDVNLSGIVTAADANMVFGNLNKATQVP